MDLLIVGCGLIGGSIAQAARRATPDLRIVGADLQSRVASGELTPHFDRTVAVENVGELLRLADQTQLVVLASPVGAILELLPRLAACTTIITDCGSTKRRIAEAGGTNPNFVPGHPMAGKPSGGIEAASPELFAEQRWILCPETASSAALSTVEAFVERLGARSIRMSASDHDAAVAVTSHVPKLLASALTVLGDSDVARLARGPGFASTTRVAGGSGAVWADILATNADNVSHALGMLSEQLNALIAALDAGDPTPAMELLDRARRLKFRED